MKQFAHDSRPIAASGSATLLGVGRLSGLLRMISNVSGMTPACQVRRLAAVTAVLGVLNGGCIAVAGSDGYVERAEHHLTVTGKPDVWLSSFGGSIEVRGWDQPDVVVVVEKLALNKSDAEASDVRIVQDGNHIVVDAQRQNSGSLFGLFNGFRRVRLIVSIPVAADVQARSGGGRISIDGVSGRLSMHSGGPILRIRTGGGSITVRSS